MNWINICWLIALGFVARLAVALGSDRVFHSDEIFQYLEQGHRLVFGNGYIPWEYRFGTRSWIIPGFIAGILWVCKALALDEPVVYIPLVKIIFCVFATSLIYSSYVLASGVADEAAGRLAALFTCVWYELVYFAHKPNPEMLAAYFIAGAAACLVSKPAAGKSLLAGFLIGGATAVRIQYLPIVAVLAIYGWIRGDKQRLSWAALAFSLTLVAAGLIDYVTWGTFAVSYYNTYFFNQIYGVSELFGTESLYYYFLCLTIASTGLFAMTGFFSVFKLRQTLLPISIIAAVLVSHSLIPHKEYRFVFVTIPFFLISLGILICEIGGTRRLKGIIGSAFIVCLLSVAGLCSSLPYQNRVTSRDLAVPLLAREDILQAYLYLSKETGLVAILNTVKGWARTGGYYYLHRDVPIYFSLDDLPKDNDVRVYASHIICAPDAEKIPGFTVDRRMRTLEIRRQTEPPSQYVVLNVDRKNVLQEGVDDRFTPTVRKRL